MRKLLLLALLLCAFRADAQVAQTGAGKGTPGSWTPAQLTGLIGWYKADVGVFTDTSCTTPATNTQTVACWKDQSGNSFNLLQATAGDRPQFLSAGLNSKQTIQFTASGNTGLLTASGVVFGTGNLASGFFIGTMTTNANSFANSVSYCGPTSASCNLSGDFITAFRNNGANSVCSDKGAVSTSGGGTGCPSVTLSTELRFGGIADGSNITSYLNNVAGTSAAVTDASANNGCISVGQGTNACNFTLSAFSGWDGVISEIVLTNTALSSSDRALLDSYLSGRW